jgi:hypothetical protein
MTDLKNRPSLDDVERMTPDEVADLPLAQIAALRSDLYEQKGKLSGIEKCIDAAMDDRFGKRARMQNETGTVRLEDEDGLSVKVEIPKRVEWDQNQLADVAATIKREWNDEPGQYLRIKYEVPESAYKHWPDSLRALFEPARTVKAGKPKFTIEHKETA